MKCPTIKNLTLSPRSHEAIRNIKRIKGFYQKLPSQLAGSQMSIIFTGNSAAVSSINLAATDFDLFGRAMEAAGSIPRKEVKKVAKLTAIRINNPPEKAFWMAIINGCGSN